MADNDLEEQVTCWVCFEVMEDPTTLGCSHSFCKDCLVKVYKRDPNCPFCRRPFGLPLPNPDPDIIALIERIRGPKVVPIEKDPSPAIDQDSPLLDLPIEVTSHIFDFLEPRHLIGAGRACKMLRSISEDPWVWKNLCMERFPFVGGGADGHDWKRVYFRRSSLQKGWEGGKSGDFTVTSMRGHDGYINCIDMLKNQVISGGSTGQIKVWRTNTSKLSYECNGHTDLVTDVKFNDIYILSGSMDRTMKLWDAQTGTLLRSMSASAGVSCIGMNANHILSTSGSDIRIYDAREANLVASRDSGHLIKKALFVDEHLVAVSKENGVEVLDRRGDMNAAVYTLARGASHMEAADGDGLLALASDSDVILYNAKTGANVWTCRLPNNSIVSTMKADSNSVVLGTKQGHLVILRHRNPAVRTVMAHEGGVNGLQFDSQRIVTAGAENTLKVWDIKTAKALYTLLGGSLQLRGTALAHPSRPGCSNLVYDENRIVASFANILKSFNFGGAEQR